MEPVWVSSRGEWIRTGKAENGMITKPRRRGADTRVRLVQSAAGEGFLGRFLELECGSASQPE